MAEKRAFVTIAVLGVAALLGQSGSLALLAGIAVPLDRMIDLVFERHDRHRRQRLRTLCGCLADELDRMVPADADTREAVRLEAERLLDRFGPSDKAFVEHHGMKAGSVADALLGHTSWSKLDLMENETSLRRVLTCFYDRLPVQAELFADLLPFIHRAHFATSRDTNAVVHELRERLVAQERDRAREFGIKEGMLIALARRYAEGSPDDFDAALAGLERALEVAREERERGRLPSNVSEAVDAVFARIDAHNDEGDLEAGQAVLDAELASMDEEDARRRAERARLYDKGIAQAILSRNVANASRFTLAKLDLEAPPDPQEAFVALRAAQDEWYERGCDKGLNFDLEVAIALARTALARATDADQRGAACNDFGTALSTLGERKSGTARLEEAITAYGSALKELNRERVPFQWATAQNNLGNALRALGQRESGTARLREAVIAYRKALEEWTRERVPLQWATAQNNLGNALRALGQRESGTARLHEAVTAYGDALQERTRERAPFDWAMTQNNLGTALQTLGERESGMTRLEDAVTAYRAALEELTRERVPLQWAG
ncbi:MAG: tetratricopeptide repeat protein, partial [Geminicoccaceae bacterium]|nr:tetratricopeptide repeat protein [Geminicoccaceae bacterium]